MNRQHKCERCTSIFVCKKCSEAASRSYQLAHGNIDSFYNLILYHPLHAIQERQHSTTQPREPWLCEPCRAAI